ncbi:MAG: GerMN domain-containing protein [Lachnospiraceae bacterium]|nr:GerMN domain-containing protein [Lachnospiraceae bacterium]
MRTEKCELKNKICFRGWMIVMLALVFLSACGTDRDMPEQTEDMDSSSMIQVYYLNKEGTALIAQPYEMVAEEQNEQIRTLLEVMGTAPDNIDMKAPLLLGFSIISYQVEGSQIVIKADETYKQLPAATEILVRAALVRTLTQIDGLDCVSIMIGEEPLLDHNGNPVGGLTADMFIDNQGSEINAYEQASLRLYFANETGNALVEVSQLVVYNSNISIERVVVDQLIAGPSNTESYPTINPNTKVNSVTIADGVCYVNLDRTFLTQPYNVTPEVAIYSIVNSLVELSNVNKVQIMIDGETAVQYRENMNFETVFSRNLDLVQSGTNEIK